MSRVDLVVLGMHRSGTSAVGRLLTALGGFAGRQTELMASKPDNPLGFYERLDVFDLNEEILARASNAWNTLCELDPEPEGSGDRAESTSRFASIASLLEGHGAFSFVKDPRLAFTADYWRPAWRPRAALIAVRHPLAVAGSLKVRNETPQPEALSLWESYNVQSLNVGAEMPHLVVSLENLVADFSSEADRLTSFLRGCGLNVEVNEELLSEAVVPSLVRQHETSPEVGLPWIDDLWNRLSALAVGEAVAAGLRISPNSRHILTVARSLDANTRKAEATEQFYRGVVSVEQRRYDELFQRRAQEVGALEGALAELRRHDAVSVSEVPGEAGEEDAAGPDCEQCCEHQEALRVAQDGEEKISTELAESRASAERLRDERDRLRDERDRLSDELEQGRKTIADLESEITRLEGRAKAAEASVEVLEAGGERDKAELEGLRGSLGRERADRQQLALEVEQARARITELEFVLENYETSRAVRWSKTINRAIGRL